MQAVLKFHCASLFFLALFSCSTRSEQSPRPITPIRVQILALNDFHGQITSRVVGGRQLGGAAVIRAHFDREQHEFPGTTFVAQIGDFIGASPPESGLLLDEPSIMFFNLLGNDWCQKADPRCNLLATLGNHEFDRGETELVRLIAGGNHPEGPFLDNPFRGSLATYVSSNVVGSPVDKHLAPFVLKSIEGVTIAFVGATTKTTKDVVRKGNLKNTVFIDEAESINRQVRQLKQRGIRTFIALIHEGGEQEPYDGPTRATGSGVEGNILSILKALDGDVDVVISGHFHNFTNAYFTRPSGMSILVTQAKSGGAAYADIELQIDRTTGDVLKKTASIKKTWADEVTPDPEALALVERAKQVVLPRISRRICRLDTPISRDSTAAGESALGDLVADAHRQAVRADIGLMNPRGLRNDLDSKDVTWGDIFAVLPFSNPVYAIALTGRQVEELLEQQWQEEGTSILQVSGLSYLWSDTPTNAHRVSDVRVGGKPLDLDQIYRVAANSFLALGGDRFTVLKEGKILEIGPLDIDALEAYLKSNRSPWRAEAEVRIRKVNRDARSN